MGSSSLGIALVAVSIRVPNPATDIMALYTSFAKIILFHRHSKY